MIASNASQAEPRASAYLMDIRANPAFRSGVGEEVAIKMRSPSSCVTLEENGRQPSRESPSHVFRQGNDVPPCVMTLSHKSICLHPQLYTVTDPHVIRVPRCSEVL